MPGIKKIIEEKSEQFSNKQNSLAEFILKNKEKVVFMTSTELAKLTSTSDATINRFVKILGFTGYVDFQRNLQVEVQSDITTLDRFSFNVDKSSINQIDKTFIEEVKIINKVINELDYEKVYNFLKMINESSDIYVFGERASTCLRNYMAYSLGKILPKVIEVTNWNEKIYKDIKYSRKPLCIFFSFPRYPKQINKIADDLNKENIDIISFSDNSITEVAKSSKITFIISYEMVAFIDPYAACMCLIHGLVDMIAANNPTRTEQCLSVFEQYAEKYEIFD